jgi:phage internal scaffolding protein
MMAYFFRTPYNYDTDEVSRETGFVCEDESLAVQSERDECDINTIVERFGLTGSLPQNVRAPMYGDFVGVSDYQSALAAVMSADEAFAEMPADVRERFKNDPAMFVDFCNDPANLDEARSLGLAYASVESPAGSPVGVSTEVPAGGE